MEKKVAKNILRGGPGYRPTGLNCEFVLASDDLGHTEIEWSVVPPNRDEDEEIIIWHTPEACYMIIHTVP